MNVGFPDVCLTPPSPGVPVPYPNFANNCLATPFSPTVFVCGLPALFLTSTIPITFGDDAGTLHPVYKKVGTFTQGNPIVFVDLIPAVNLTCPTTGNAMNNMKGAQLVPSAVNVFYTYAAPRGEAADPAPGPAPRRPDPAEEAAALEASLRGAPPPAAAMLPDGVGLLRVSAFTADLPARAHDAIRALEAAGMRGLILDLRDNPGGELRAFVELAGDFLPPGEVIVTALDGDGDEVVHRSRRDRRYAMPLAVLVNRGTASAAELFAGSLQAHRRAVIVGEATFGKAVAQSLARAQDGSGAWRLAAARCELPGGAPSIQGVGVCPDIEPAPGAPPSEGASEALDRDPPLAAASRAVLRQLGGA
jgi:carboxyl-terminal processing protease